MKFSEDRDIVSDLGIGSVLKIKEYLERYCHIKKEQCNVSGIETEGFMVDIVGNIDLRHKGLTILYHDPKNNIISEIYSVVNDKDEISYLDWKIHFRNISGDFLCSHNKLESLIGAPKNVDGDFDCSNNKLTDLIFAPKRVCGNFYCGNQKSKVKNIVEPVESCVGGIFHSSELIDAISFNSLDEDSHIPAIINIDSEIDLNNSDRRFIRKVLFGSDKPEFSKDSIQFLAYRIPIYLVNEKTYEKFEKENTCTLGFYVRLKNYFNDSPAIFICPEVLVKASNSKKIQYKLILSKVIIHEFAHALMDTNKSTFQCFKNEVDLDFFKHVEEPFANYITLMHFEKNAQEFLAEIIRFIDTQPDQYKPGNTFYKEKFGRWEEWREKKILICQGGNEIAQKEWVKSVKSDPPPNLHKLNELFEKLLKD